MRKKITYQPFLVDGTVDGSKDIIDSFRRLAIPVHLAVHDVKQRYRRSRLGPIWFLLNNIIFVGVLGILYAQIFKVSAAEYLSYLMVGIIIWQFVSTSMTEGTHCFIEARNFIQQTTLPLSIHCQRQVIRNLIILAHSLPLLLVAPIIANGSIPAESLTLPISLGLSYLNAVWISIVFGLIGARYRDFLPLVQNFVTLAFFFTPIMWMPHLLSERAAFVELNPFYHFISIFRDPLLYGNIPLKSFTIVVLITTIGLTMANILMKRFKHRVAYCV